MPNRSAVFVALALAAGLSACATPTPYQPNVRGQATSGGYSDMKIEANRWRVTFAGNSLTTRETVEGYLLYRAAELTQQNGYDWFRLADKEVNRDSRTYVEPDPFYRPWYGSYGFWRPSWRYYGGRYGWRTWDPFYGDPFWADRMDVRTIERFEATAEITMGRGAKPADDTRAFDARAVVENLGPRIQRPPVK
ncbi:MAG: hypothetical protein ABI655_07705 [Phenylobacterium sp.]